MSKAAAAGRATTLSLALAQFMASYAATNMNAAISAVATDLGTTVCLRPPITNQDSPAGSGGSS